MSIEKELSNYGIPFLEALVKVGPIPMKNLTDHLRSKEPILFQ